ncbi:MAG: AAA domain-containing protein [Thermosulfidibacteraceae bacterium]
MNKESEITYLCENFIEALKREIEYIKQNEGDISFDLHDGQLVENYGDYFVYQFFTKSPIEINEDIPIKLWYKGSIYEGVIIGINGCEVFIGSSENLGKIVSKIKIELNNTYLLQKLQEKIQEIIKKKPTYFHGDNALKAFCFLDALSGLDFKFLTPFDKLNLSLSDEQKNALTKVLGSEVTFIWGPPGTGKTTVISCLVSELLLRNYSVLLTSHTNIAVDNALERIAEILKKQQNNEYLNGGILRIGPPFIKDLFKRFPELSFDYWINIKSRALKERLKKLITKKDFLKSLLSSIKEFTKEAEKLFNQIDNLKAQMNRKFNEIASLNVKIKEREHSISNIQKDIEKITQKMESAKNTFWLLRMLKGLNLEKLENELKVYKERKIKEEQKLISLKTQHKNLTVEYKKTEENQEKLLQESFDLLLKIKNFFEKNISTLNISTNINSLEEAYNILDQKKSEIKIKLEKIDTMIKQIKTKLEELKRELIKKATVIGTTLTRTYLLKELYEKKFDVVIIDEASTALLPALFFVCGLANSKIVIVGDFKQLGPIVRNADDEIVKNWLKRDIFDITEFAKKIESGLEEEKIVILQEQRRMPEEILTLINDLIYGGRLKPLKNKTEAEKIINSAPFPGNTVILCDTSDFNPRCNKDESNSPWNMYHALLSVYLAEQALLNRIDSVAIITPYRAQNKLIHKLVFEKELAKNVIPSTIHRFQGKESDLVIFDLVESPPKKVKWLATGDDTMKLLNVGITRAKSKLIIVANLDYLKKQLPQDSILSKILKNIEINFKIINSREVFEFPGKVQPKNYQFTGFCNEKDFYKLFIEDLLQAKETVLIVSPFLGIQRILYFQPFFEKLRENRVKIFIVTRPVESQQIKQKLKDLQIEIIEKPNLHEKIAIIDYKILWHGSLNILSHKITSELMKRDLITGEIVNEILKLCGISVKNNSIKKHSFPYSRFRNTESTEYKPAKCTRKGLSK